MVGSIGMLFLAGCQMGKEAEEEITVIEATSQPGNLSVTLEGRWSLLEPGKLPENQSCDLLAEDALTDAGISIVYEDLTLTEGGSLIRMEEYLALMQEKLTAEDAYTYTCEEVTTREIAGETYYTFTALEETLGARLHYFVRRIGDTVMIMTITLYDGSGLENLLNGMRAV